MRAHSFELQNNGITLGGWSWTPADTATGVVVIAHGMAEHGERYADLAEALTGEGLAVIAVDHRGHKLTARTLDRAGFVAERDGWRLMRDDLVGVLKHARMTHPGLPIALLGHSMGSLLARDVAANHPGLADALVITGVVGDPGPLGAVGRVVARTQQRIVGADKKSTLLNRLTFGGYNSSFTPARTPFDWLSRDESVVDAYLADPWCGFVCATSFYDALIGAAERVNGASVARRTPDQLPVLLVTGSRDPVGGAKAASQVVDRYRAAGLTDVTSIVVEDARHEVLKDTQGTETTGQLVAWIAAKLGRAS